MNIAAKFILDCIFDNNWINRHFNIYSIYSSDISVILVSNFTLFMVHDDIWRNENEDNKIIMSDVCSYISISCQQW